MDCLALQVYLVEDLVSVLDVELTCILAVVKLYRIVAVQRVLLELLGADRYRRVCLQGRIRLLLEADDVRHAVSGHSDRLAALLVHLLHEFTAAGLMGERHVPVGLE